jgi:hypothetical protein
MDRPFYDFTVFFAENANDFADFSFISPKPPTISPKTSIISPNATPPHHPLKRKQ